MIAAGIDCGTNSIRLMIGEIGEGEPASAMRILERRTTIVRLGQGVDVTGEFAPEALERTFAAAEDYAQIIAGYPVERIRFAATSASRDAKNREVFFEGIRQRLGVTPEVISGDEEAQLSFRGASLGMGAEAMADGARVLVIDLGGGSTEFVTGALSGGSASVEAAVSTQMGSVRFTERFFRQDPPSAQDLDDARAAVREILASAGEQVDLTGLDAVVGVAGTITTVFSGALGLSAYSSEAVNGARVPLEQVRESALFLATAPREVRAQLGYLHPGRVDVIGAGAIIFDTVLDELHRLNPGLDTVVASERDILDALTLSALCV